MEWFASIENMSPSQKESGGWNALDAEKSGSRMKTNLTHPMTFFILGVPRSGTTILCNLFDALEDGQCFGEPHWWSYKEAMSSEKYIYGIFQKECLARKLSNPAGLFGYKETYKGYYFPDEQLIKLHVPQVDFFLIVFRDPVMTHSSQRALGWKEWDRPDDFNQSYKRLDELAEHEKGIAIVYEQFVKAPLEYLNERLPFQIEGPLELKPTGHTFGDPFANRSTEIVKSQRQICLTNEEIEAHRPGIEIWRKWIQKTGS